MLLGVSSVIDLPLKSGDHNISTSFIQFGERVVNEDRSKEFKHYDTRDSHFTLRKLREHVARCVCGFLNSQQSGLVLIGITEEGKFDLTEIEKRHKKSCLQCF